MPVPLGINKASKNLEHTMAESIKGSNTRQNDYLPRANVNYGKTWRTFLDKWQPCR